MKGTDMTWITKACTPTLPPTEVNDLCRRFASGDDGALQLLISSHVAFVTSVAQRYSALGVPVEDLVSEGILGLIEAARRFDVDRGNRFLTYAVFWIRRQILDSLRRDSQPIRRPRNAPRPSESTATQRTVQAPRALSMNEASSRTASDVPLYFQSLDQASASGVGAGISETLEDTAAECPEDGVLRDDARRVIWSALDRLRPKQRLVVALRHGLCDDRRWTLREVGSVIGVSRERVRQIELQAMDQLRRGLRRVTAPPVRPRNSQKSLRPQPLATIHRRRAWSPGVSLLPSREAVDQPSRRSA
jgi:RNA polymerase sigma factor (sigma-70 family)